MVECRPYGITLTHTHSNQLQPLSTMTNGIESLLSIKNRWRPLVPDKVVVKVVRPKLKKKIVFIVVKDKKKKGRPTLPIPIKSMTLEQKREYTRTIKYNLADKNNPNRIKRTSRKYFIGPLTKKQTSKKKLNEERYRVRHERNSIIKPV